MRLIICITVLICTVTCAAQMRGPWDTQEIDGTWSHTFTTADAPAVTSNHRSINELFLLPLRMYRRFLSPIDGLACPSYPSCSAYAQQALLEYGFFMGILLTVDRLIHENGGTVEGLYIKIGGKYKIYDPLSSAVTSGKQKNDAMQKNIPDER